MDSRARGHFGQKIAIPAGELPAECIIDEEGYGKILRATARSKKEILFEILDWVWEKGDDEDQPVYIHVRMNKREFLAEFIRAWDEFIQQDG